MQEKGRTPVKFERPPIVEVACGATFALDQPLKQAHVGLFWSKIRDKFPRTEDAAPLGSPVEIPQRDGFLHPQQLGVEFVEGVPVPLRRSWLLNESGTHLVQIQEDRFVFNWKRTEANPDYPSYQFVIAGFWEQWFEFIRFLQSEGLGAPKIRQLEMTYFNVLPWEGKYLVDHQRREADRFLPEPELTGFKSAYFVEELVGRLHVTAQPARHTPTGQKATRLEITARGLPKEVTSETCAEWFDTAHVWITHGFADMTSPEAHKVWGRIS